nr:MAG TPA: hypothetical protein [Caudoviricetes sp.]
MKTSKKLAIYYRYRDTEIEIRNNLLELFELYEDYRKSKYKSVGNYLRYVGYQAMADKLIYEYEEGYHFLSMMTTISDISYELYDVLKYVFNKYYSSELLNEKVKIAFYSATHLTI